ncbi:MAG: response regulator, partial [Spirochaetia bacterium]|nr:response regulator [Spirochaetia bacterium]
VITQKKILVAVGDEERRKSLADYLELWGYQSIAVGSDREGAAAILQQSPDLVIIDLKLPEEGGLPLLRTMRETAEYRAFVDTPVIVLSEDTSDEVQIVCMSNGANDFLALPVKTTELAMKVQLSLELASSRRQLRDLNERLARDKRILSKYFSADFVESVLREEIPSDLGGDTLEATIMFFDVRGSTTIAERIGPRAYAELISDLFGHLMDIILSNGGSINDLLGDGLLATFGCPKPLPDAAARALASAAAIRAYVAEWNRSGRGASEPLAFGMGIASGKVFAGNIGSKHRQKYAVMGDPVNLAARLQDLSKDMQHDILLDNATTERAAGTRVEREGTVSIRGKVQPVTVYYLPE